MCALRDAVRRESQELKKFVGNLCRGSISSVPAFAPHYVPSINPVVKPQWQLPRVGARALHLLVVLIITFNLDDDKLVVMFEKL